MKHNTRWIWIAVYLFCKNPKTPCLKKCLRLLQLEMHISIFFQWSVFQFQLRKSGVCPRLHIYRQFRLYILGSIFEQQIKKIHIFVDHVILDTTNSSTVSWKQFVLDVKYVLNKWSNLKCRMRNLVLIKSASLIILQLIDN